ncbi:hypothetical protein [Gimesia aquarii]|uniref:Carboxypeptidase regulatory-like domain-containing protein n=1 Tax=Gimesia aquarii TaxID=2527964 RepID=A0A517WQT1_9PLAN|nr:hypothetical protein [Gimesia aquarii]QDU07611.1 hypothetical protein V202x_09700 [Gimesia aquarii]
MRGPTFGLQLFCYAIVLLIFTGCGGTSDAPQQVKVEGTVTFDGEPLSTGSIVFDPSDGKGGSSAGGIENGKFQFDSQLGKKKVLISATRETGEKDQYDEPITESYIPKQYNSETTLTAEVKPDGENKFEFALKSK